MCHRNTLYVSKKMYKLTFIDINTLMHVSMIAKSYHINSYLEKSKVRNNFICFKHSFLRLNAALSSHGLFSQPHSSPTASVEV